MLLITKKHICCIDVYRTALARWRAAHLESSKDKVSDKSYVQLHQKCSPLNNIANFLTDILI